MWLFADGYFRIDWPWRESSWLCIGSGRVAGPCGANGLGTNQPANRAAQEFVARLKLFFNPPEQPSVPAVCIPPGARLVVEDIPASLHRALGVGPIELVTFTQFAAAPGTYRDAVRFKNGREVRLQEFLEGRRMWIMDLSGDEALQAVRESISRV